MAHAMTFDPGASGFGGAAGLVARARKALADHRLYRQTVAELEALSDRDLSDLNVARFAINDVARASVYGR
jgi:uncharacterized protein YjiS (DUF1127 family)